MTEIQYSKPTDREKQLIRENQNLYRANQKLRNKIHNYKENYDRQVYILTHQSGSTGETGHTMAALKDSVFTDPT